MVLTPHPNGRQPPSAHLHADWQRDGCGGPVLTRGSKTTDRGVLRVASAIKQQTKHMRDCRVTTPGEETGGSHRTSAKRQAKRAARSTWGERWVHKHGGFGCMIRSLVYWPAPSPLKKISTIGTITNPMKNRTCSSVFCRCKV